MWKIGMWRSGNRNLTFCSFLEPNAEQLNQIKMIEENYLKGGKTHERTGGGGRSDTPLHSDAQLAEGVSSKKKWLRIWQRREKASSYTLFHSDAHRGPAATKAFWMATSAAFVAAECGLPTMWSACAALHASSALTNALRIPGGSAYVWICIGIHIHRYMYICIYIYIHINTYIYIRFVCLHQCLADTRRQRLFINMYKYTCIYIHIHIHIYMYIHKYIYVYTFAFSTLTSTLRIPGGSAHVWICLSIHMNIHTNTYICIHVTYIYTYICFVCLDQCFARIPCSSAYVSICISIYIYIHTYTYIYIYI